MNEVIFGGIQNFPNTPPNRRAVDEIRKREYNGQDTIRLSEEEVYILGFITTAENAPKAQVLLAGLKYSQSGEISATPEARTPLENAIPILKDKLKNLSKYNIKQYLTIIAIILYLQKGE
jgi:hypothetical protein